MASVPNTTSYVSPNPSAFSVAIVGGGIGGLSLALGLLRHPHIDVHVYESAPSFGEIGAGVAIGPNAQRALELISPAARAAFDKHATPNLWPSKANNFAEHIVVGAAIISPNLMDQIQALGIRARLTAIVSLQGKGNNAGEVIDGQKNATGMQSVHRARFLDELVKGVPAQRAHFNKRLQKINESEAGPVELCFKDGTTATADTVIGADGIHSAVREHLLGPEAAKPRFSGSVCYRGIPTMDVAIEKLGAEYAQNSMMLCGPGKYN